MFEQAKNFWQQYGLSITSLIMILFLVAAFYKIHQPNVLPIKQVIITGAPQTYQTEVQQVINASLATGLLTLNLQQLIDKIDELSWVAAVKVERRWPDSLIVNIQQQAPVAIWNNNTLLNDYAETFIMPETLLSSFTQTLPQLNGPAGSQLKVLYYYQQFNQLLQTINLQISQITLESNEDWQLILNNGLKIQLGQQDILTRLQRFVKVYNNVFAAGQKQAIAVNLDYPNGMAVQWGAN
ncbi:MAG: hypothetical protein A3E87_08865 [Gammaproteobacteria bacterium RIFCSPHIGHO2_12_FULL_35_23]|nr:MAG: hypothetical protein A3E87_08865 [Gammaproteobacteria bacterium RIFCSPHIGHO2_12_FULL_35_23]